MTRRLFMMYFLLILLDGVLLTNYHQAMSNSVSIEPTARIQLTSDEKTWSDMKLFLTCILLIVVVLIVPPCWAEIRNGI
jgi:hypothetical protein